MQQSRAEHQLAQSRSRSIRFLRFAWPWMFHCTWCMCLQSTILLITQAEESHCPSVRASLCTNPNMKSTGDGLRGGGDGEGGGRKRIVFRSPPGRWSFKPGCLDKSACCNCNSFIFFFEAPSASSWVSALHNVFSLWNASWCTSVLRGFRPLRHVEAHQLSQQRSLRHLFRAARLMDGLVLVSCCSSQYHAAFLEPSLFHC